MLRNVMMGGACHEINSTRVEMAANIEHEALTRCSSGLTDLLQHNLHLSSKLLEKGLVTEQVHGWVLTAHGVSNQEKAARLVSCVSDRVKTSGHLYSAFLEILKGELYFKEIVERICAEHSMFSLCVYGLCINMNSISLNIF